MLTVIGCCSDVASLSLVVGMVILPLFWRFYLFRVKHGQVRLNLGKSAGRETN